MSKAALAQAKQFISDMGSSSFVRPSEIELFYFSPREAAWANDYSTQAMSKLLVIPQIVIVIAVLRA